MTKGRVYDPETGFYLTIDDEPGEWKQAKIVNRGTYEAMHSGHGLQFIALGEDEKLKAAGGAMLPGFEDHNG